MVDGLCVEDTNLRSQIDATVAGFASSKYNGPLAHLIRHFKISNDSDDDDDDAAAGH